MKKFKVLPLLLVAPLLTSCGKSYKAPKFAKLGDSVAPETWNEKFNEAMDTVKLIPTGEEKFKSLVAVDDGGSQNDISVKRGKNVVESYSDYYKYKTTHKYDSANLLFESAGKSESITSEKNSSGYKSETKSKTNSLSMKQVAKVEDKYHIVTVDEKLKSYTRYIETTEESKVDDFNSVIAMNVGLPFITIGLIYTSYEMQDEETKKDYTFYQNDKVFTVEILHKEENKEYKVADEVKYITNETQLVRMQAQIISESKVKLVSYEETKTTKTYSVDYGDYYKGDVYERVYKTGSSYEVELKDVSLKAVDLSDYARLGTAW